MFEKKTIAVMASLDTKGAEVSFIHGMIERLGHNPFIIDIGARPHPSIVPEIKALQIVQTMGHPVHSLMELPKNEMIDILKEGAAIVCSQLYVERKIDALFCFGGLQNTVVGVSAMINLPIGFPKLIVSTVASGQRAFKSIVGSRDICVFPSITDFTGGNVISDTIIQNAVAAICGMAENGKGPIDSAEDFLIGATTMGVVNDAVTNTIEKVKQSGYQVVSFHSTGAGGRILDELIGEGIIKAVMDFSPHEIVCEILGGYSSGSNDRLLAAGKAGIPQIVAPGALDFIDFSTDNMPDGLLKRKHVFHNSGLVHARLNKDEIHKIGHLVTERLNSAKGPVTMLLPLKGFRAGSRSGEAMYDPELDNALIGFFKKNLNNTIKIVEIDCHINDGEFSTIAAEETIALCLHS